MKILELRNSKGRRAQAAQYELVEWNRLPWWLKAYSWACATMMLSRGWRPR
jgi:hypothetical protein